MAVVLNVRNVLLLVFLGWLVARLLRPPAADAEAAPPGRSRAAGFA